MIKDSDFAEELLRLRILSALCGAAVLLALKSLWDRNAEQAFIASIGALILFYVSYIVENQILSKR